MNVFEKHGVMHLSASTLNLWVSQPARCLMKIADKLDGSVGASAWRGTAVDKVVTRKLQNPEFPIQRINYASSILSNYSLKN